MMVGGGGKQTTEICLIMVKKWEEAKKYFLQTSNLMEFRVEWNGSVMRMNYARASDDSE